MLEVFRNRLLGIIHGICSRFPGWISSNHLSIFSLSLGILAGIMLYWGRFLMGSISIAGSSLLDLLDGGVARIRGETPRGDLLDHVSDRYADVFIICGPVLGGYVDWRLGLVALTGVLLTSYLGTCSQALGLGRLYSGLISRSDRLALVFLGGILIWIHPGKIHGLSLLEWCFLGIGIGSHITALQRFALIWIKLGVSDRN